MNNNYLFRIGMVLAVLMVFAAPAAAENRAYFVPQHSNATIGNYTYVTLYVDIEDDQHLAGGQIQVKYDPAHVKITACTKSCGPPTEGKTCWEAHWTNLTYTDNGYMWNGMDGPQVAVWDADDEYWYWDIAPDDYFVGPMTVKICKYKVEAVGTPGESPFNFSFEHFPGGCPVCQKSKLVDDGGIELDITWENGTFTHLAGPVETETFTKSLVSGWNLISLPLTPLDNSVSLVLDGVSQNAVKQYNATTHQFEDATSMDPGIGYFVNVTAAGTWEYEGTAYTSMTTSLSQGLNMVGWTNTSAALPGALNSISGNYSYVAHWNATSQSYEVYEPNAPEVFNDFATMERGEGYFIAATEDCTLTYA
jgi:hypothetical protein